MTFMYSYLANTFYFSNAGNIYAEIEDPPQKKYKCVSSVVSSRTVAVARAHFSFVVARKVLRVVRTRS